jgi:hypothetical protein
MVVPLRWLRELVRYPETEVLLAFLLVREVPQVLVVP